MNNKELEEKIYTFGNVLYNIGRMETDGKDTTKDYNKMCKEKEKLKEEFDVYFKNKKAGVTLIELMVVISIFAIISATVIVDYRSFSSSISTQNLADDIALSIRKAQGYAIGVRGYNNIFNGYGIHFALDIKDVEGPYYCSSKLFILFLFLTFSWMTLQLLNIKSFS
jgi:prepilin-type N-terminal cleavage/methylation domain-containing protein